MNPSIYKPMYADYKEPIVASKKFRAVHIVFSIVALLGLWMAFAPAGKANTKVAPILAGEPVSDDFDSCILNNDLWTFTDPQDDTTISFDGSVASMILSGDVEHDLWENKNQAPRLMQPIANVDFEMEVKFESEVTKRFQTQGIIIEADAHNYLRFDFYHDGTDTKLFAASFAAGVPTIQYNETITPTASAAGYFLRVNRQGDDWLQQYSFNGADGDWTSGASFNLALTTTKGGIFGGNATPGGTQLPPAFTMIADYVFNTASPLSPEDSEADELVLSIEGQGTINPPAGSYTCGEQVVLTAAPANGWFFEQWKGDLVDTASPATVTIDGVTNVTAVFVESAGRVSTYLPVVLQ